MPDFRVEVDADTADALQVECDLLGFDDPEAYLQWIVDNRAAIEQGTESAELLEAYQQRLVALEQRLVADGIDPESVDGEVVADRSELDADTAPDPSPDADGAASQRTEDPATANRATGGSPSAGDTGHTDEPRAGASSSGADADRATGTESTGAADRAASDGGTGAEGITSMHLRPERVQRVSEDPVAEDAGVLADVETTRLDELSRRAVAKTRERLDRDVETGLAYASSTVTAGSSVRPGEDVTDLDTLDVPGRSEELVDRRREAVGRALALLRDEGRARRSTFVDALYEEYPAGYDTADGWWRCIREGLAQVDAVDGGHVWEFET